jgi:Fe-S-cluster containining protein
MPFDGSMRSIRLHAHGAIDITEDRVYFPFASGVFEYDCVRCNAKCCRGYGYLAATATELRTQARLRPTLPLFVEPGSKMTGGQLRVGNCAPGCFFLSSTGRCQVHERDGYAAKPETCRLFPFNNVRRLSAHLVVAPHDSLCPLSVAGLGATSSCSDHATLLAGMSEQGIAARVPPFASLSDEDLVVAHERRIVDLSKRFLDDGDFLSLARAQCGLDVERAGRAGLPGVEQVLHGVATILGLPEDRIIADRALGRVMVAATPYLRMPFVFGERDPAKRVDLPAERAGVAVTCLYAIAACANATGMAEVSFQTLTKLARDFRGLVSLLARSDEILVWRDDAPIDVAAFEDASTRPAFLRLTKRLLPRSQRTSPTALGALLIEHAPQDFLERTLFLKRVAKLVAGKLVPPMTRARAARMSQRFHGAMHRWVLGNVDEGLLGLAYDRLAARQQPTVS